MRALALAALLVVDGCACEGALGPADASLDVADARSDAPTVTCGTPGSVRDGDPCACDTDCVEGAVCFAEAESGFAGNLCARLCASGPCSAGATCWTDERICSTACTTSDECGPLRACTFGGFCTGRCASDADCLGGTCDRFNGECGPPAPGPGGVLDPCDSPDDCRSQACAGDLCWTECDADTPTCPDGSACFVVRVPERLGICAPLCPGGACPSHLACIAGAGEAGESLCLPP